MRFGSNPFIKDLAWLFFEYSIRFFLSFLVGLKLAQFLGVEKFGILNYCLGIISLVYVFSKFGMETVIIKEMVDKSETGKVLGTSYLINVILLLFSAVLLYVFKLNYREFIFILFFGLLFRSFDTIQYYLFAESMGRIAAKIALAIDIIGNGLKIVFLLFSFDFHVLFFLFVIVDLITGLIYIFSYKKINKNNLDWKVNFKLLKKIIVESGPFFISSLAVTAYMKIDQIIIENLLGNSSVGIYAVAVRLVELWYFIPTIIISVIFPQILKMQNTKQIEEFVQVLLEILAFIAIVIMFVAIAFAEQIVFYTYGEQFMGAVPILKLYSTVLIFVFVGSFRGRLMIINNLQSYLILFGVSGVVLNVILNYLLIPLYGLEGSAIASIITLVCTNHLLLILPKKTRSIFHLQNRALIKFWRVARNIKILNIYRTQQ